MPSLFPSSVPPGWRVPSPLLRRPSRPAQPTPVISYAYDPIALDIAVDGAGRVRYASTDQTSVQAAAFVLSIQPGRYPIFSPRFGCDLEACIITNQSRSAQERAIATEMRRAITATQDQRFKSLDDFVFDWHTPGVVDVTYTLSLSSGARVRMNRRITTP